MIFIFVFLFSLKSWSKDIVLTVGESKKISSSGKIWIENGKIIQAEELGNTLLIKAKKPGISELKLSTEVYTVSVLSIAQAKTFDLLQKISKKTLNTRVTIQNGEVVILGRIQNWNDWKKYYTACKNKKCRFSFLADMDQEIFKKSETNIQELISKVGLPKLNIENGNGYFVKIPDKTNYFKSLEYTLSAFGIGVIVDRTAIDIAPLVKVQITVAEVKRDFVQKIGLKWPSVSTGQTAQLLNSNIELHSLETNGIGRILAMPNILCRSGKDAEFIAGGEFPIKILSPHVHDVVWKRYGILLKVKPIADYAGRMNISIETEISSIDPHRSVDGIPALFTNRVQSHFDLIQTRTIALSGLIKNEESKNSDGLPWLSRIPILGALFSSKEFRDNKTELVIFVRPEIINANSSDENINLPTSIL